MVTGVLIFYPVCFVSNPVHAIIMGVTMHYSQYLFLTNKVLKKRKPVPSIALTTDSSILTSISNESEFKFVFSRQIEAIGNKNDTLVAITTSGKSKNILEALKVCQKKKYHLVLGILSCLLKMIFLSTHDQGLDYLM